MTAERRMSRFESVLLPFGEFVLCLIGASAFHRVLAPGPLAAMIGAGALAAAVAWLPRLSARLRRSLLLPALVVIVSWPVLAVVALGLAAPEAGVGPVPGGHALLAVLRGARDGWWRMLTTIPPLGADGPALAAVSAAVALAASLALQTAHRSRRVLLASAPAFGLLILGLLAGGPGSDLPTAVSLTAGTALLMALGSGRSRAREAGSPDVQGGTARSPREAQPKRSTRAVLGRVVVALECTALVAALGFGGGALASADTKAPPFDPRTLITPPERTSSPVNPLDQVGFWLSEPDSELFSVVGDSSAVPLRLVVLDRFDGSEWTSAAEYTPTGSRIPSADTDGTDATDVGAELVQQIEIQNLDSLWLPAAPRPSRLEAVPTGVTVDPAGDLLVPAGDHPGLAYTVVSAVPQYPASQLRDAVPAADPADLVLPGTVPAVISGTARAAVSGAAFPYQQAEQLAGYLRGHEKADPTAPSGHSYGHLAYFLGTSHRGTSEQFATAFAVMARTLGLPTRIAVGFAVPAAASAAVPVTGADALVWPEVDFAGLGWVPFFPTPAGTAQAAAGALPVGESAARQAADSKLGSVTVPQAAVQRRPAAESAPAAGASTAPTSGVPLWWWACAALAGIVLAYASVSLGGPGVRRTRRRRIREPGRAVLAAWHEAVELLALLGLPQAGRGTSAQACSFAGQRLADAGPGGPVGALALSRLAGHADRVGFGAEAAAPEAAAVAWREFDLVLKAFREAIPLRLRVLHRLLRRKTARGWETAGGGPGRESTRGRRRWRAGR